MIEIMNRVMMRGSQHDAGELAIKPRRKFKVFIVEDEPLALQMYVDLLMAFSPGSFQIQKFTDGDEAWSELTKMDPDALITDMVHPGLDGGEMLKLLAAEKVTYPILVVAGDGESSDYYKNLHPNLKLSVLGRPFKVQSFHQLLSSLLPTCDHFTPLSVTARPLLKMAGVALR